MDTTAAQRVERYERLLKVMQGLTPHQRREHFDITTWGYRTECGTVACAAGHAGLNTWFRRHGFTMTCTRREGYAFPGMQPSEFFGGEGMNIIFTNGRLTTVPLVIKRVKEFIKQLKERPDSVA